MQTERGTIERLSRPSTEVARDLRANLARREALKAELARSIEAERATRDAAVIADYRTLTPIKEIQRKYRVSQWQIYKLVEARGIHRPMRKTMPADVRRRYDLGRYRDGLSAEDAYAQALGHDLPPRAHRAECREGVSP